jgi:hypothetical protein
VKRNLRKLRDSKLEHPLSEQRMYAQLSKAEVEQWYAKAESAIRGEGKSRESEVGPAVKWDAHQFGLDVENFIPRKDNGRSGGMNVQQHAPDIMGRRETDGWAWNDAVVQALFFSMVPATWGMTDREFKKRQTAIEKAEHLARVFQLYFRMGLDERAVAHEMHTTEDAIQWAVKILRVKAAPFAEGILP